MGSIVTNNDQSTHSIKGITLPKLAKDGSNLVVFQEHLENAVCTTKGLQKHLEDTALKPELLEQRLDGKVYIKDSKTALTKEEAAKQYNLHEAQVREFIYRTISTSTFIQINGKSSAEVWNKLIAMHTKRGEMFQKDLLNQLQTIWYIKGEDMRTHLGSMKHNLQTPC